MNNQYLSFLEWNKTYYLAIQMRLGRIKDDERISEMINMYLDYLVMYLSDDWVNNISNAVLIPKLHSYDNEYKSELFKFSELIPLIIQGSKPITNNAVEVSELIFKVNLDQHIRLNQNNKK